MQSQTSNGRRVSPGPQMRSNSPRRAYHDAGHVVVALCFNIPVISATIEDHPHVHAGHYRGSPEPLALMALSGPESERMVFGDPLPLGADELDVANARRYLSDLARLRQSPFVDVTNVPPLWSVDRVLGVRLR